MRDENGSVAKTTRGAEQGYRRLHAEQWLQRGAGGVQEGDGHAGRDRQEICRPLGEEMDLSDSASEESETTDIIDQ